jgi:hypothetical protein
VKSWRFGNHQHFLLLQHENTHTNTHSHKCEKRNEKSKFHLLNYRW